MTQAGTARSERELEVLTARAKELIRARVPQPLLVVEPFDDGAGAVETPIPVTGERAGYLVDAISRVYRDLLKRLVRTLRRYRSFTLAINTTTIHTAMPLPPETAELITKLEKSDRNEQSRVFGGMRGMN